LPIIAPGPKSNDDTNLGQDTSDHSGKRRPSDFDRFEVGRGWLGLSENSFSVQGRIVSPEAERDELDTNLQRLKSEMHDIGQPF
jgi:hypothetical protein